MRRSTLLGLALTAAAGAAAWEVQRRIDARRVAADPETAELERRLPSSPVEVTSADGTRLHAEVFGPDDAPTIVLVHGWTCALDFWHYQLRDLSRDFRVVAYDQRGHGRSQPPQGGEYTRDALADDLQAVLQACVPAGQRCVVAGHSMGGMTVVAWAGRHHDQVAERLAAAALVDTGMGDLVKQALVLRVPFAAAFQERLATRILTAPLTLPTSSSPISHRLARYIAMSPSASPGQVAFFERMTLTCPAPARHGFGRSLSTLDLYESVPALTVPTLVVVGELDRLTPPWHARRLADSLPRPHALVEIPGVGHNAPLEAPAEVTGQIRALAREHLVAATSRSSAGSSSA